MRNTKANGDYKIPLPQNLFVYTAPMWKTGRYNGDRLRCYLSCSSLLCSTNTCGMFLSVAYRITTASNRAKKQNIIDFYRNAYEFKFDITNMQSREPEKGTARMMSCTASHKVYMKQKKRPTNGASLNLFSISVSLKLKENRQKNLEEEVLHIKFEGLLLFLTFWQSCYVIRHFIQSAEFTKWSK